METLNQKLRKKASELPLLPGVYIMKNSRGKIIYIGKAKALKNRVSQYFAKLHTGKVGAMVANVNDFEYIVADSEYEALVLECSLIKQHKPKYNILLKDDKGYCYIRISDDKFPKITYEKNKLEGGKYFGPFLSGFVARETVDECNRLFMLPTCKRVFPRDFRKERPCLNYHIGRCVGLCRGKVTAGEYGEIILSAEEFIKSGGKQVVKTLTAQMQSASEALDFEKAAKLRDRINAINKSAQKQLVVMDSDKNADYCGSAINGDIVCFVILKIRGGLLVDKLKFMVEVTHVDPSEHMAEFLTSYYMGSEDIPPVIWSHFNTESMDDIAKLLGEKAGRKVQLSNSQRGEPRSLTLMACDNAAQELSHFSSKGGREIAQLNELQQILNLDKIPEYIESYDISHTSGADVVAGMIVFKKGVPFKVAYRKFNIKTTGGNDDYGAMREVAIRRFYRLVKEDNDLAFGKKPDLILLDGGKGQVKAFKDVADEYGVNVPIYGLVKDSKHRTRGITDTGGEIGISPRSKAFNIITKIQDEVHRYAITFHHAKHRKNALATQLEKAPGIGKVRATNLLKHFGSLKKIKEADAKDIAMVKGMSEKSAEELVRYIKEEL